VDYIVWEKKSSAKGVPPVNMLVNVHEYIIAYQRSNKFSFLGEHRSLEGFSNPDNDPRGPWRNTNIKSTVKDKSQVFTITDPKTGNSFTDTWAYSKEEIERLIKENYLIFPKNKKWTS
jgi:adenine-specific DNA-methyltransferase